MIARATLLAMLLMTLCAMLRAMKPARKFVSYLFSAQAQTTLADTKERFRITFTATSKSQFVPGDQVYLQFPVHYIYKEDW